MAATVGDRMCLILCLLRLQYVHRLENSGGLGIGSGSLAAGRRGGQN